MDFDTHPDNFTQPAEPTAPQPVEPASPAEPAPTTISFGSEAQQPPKKPRRRLRKLLFWTLAVAAATLLAAMWIRYFNPYGVGAQECGYVSTLECRGYLFKTWEGQMVVKSALADSTGIYSRSFDFSVASPAVADELLRLKNAGSEVVVTYERYFGTLPWRGEHRYVVTAATAAPTVAPTPEPAESAEPTQPAEPATQTNEPTKPAAEPEFL